MFPREILNRIKWTGNKKLAEVEVWYVHRGAPNDRKMVEGHRILRLEPSFFILDARGRETSIS